MKLSDYIQGERRGREARDLERQALEDPFLADALEGYEAAADDPEHGKAVERLRTHVSFRTRGHALRQRRRRPQIPMWGIAASLLLCIVLGGYLVTLERHRAPEVALLSEPADSLTSGSDTLPVPAVKTPPEPAEEKIIARNERRKQPVASSDILNIVADETIRIEYAEFDEEAITVAPQAKMKQKESTAEQRIVVTGIVRDRDMNPLAGATVVVSGTSRGTSTNGVGTYSITAAPGDRLIFSFIGYLSQEHEVSSGSLDVVLAPDPTGIDQVVVVGYGTVKKQELTGAVPTLAAGKAADSFSVGFLAKPVEAQRADMFSDSVAAASGDNASDEPFLIVEQMPRFQDGDLSKFREWVYQRLKYPPSLAECGITGKVILVFVIERDGSLTHVEVLQSPHELLSVEAVRVVESSPKWTPGYQRGVPIRVKFTMPVDFRIRE